MTPQTPPPFLERMLLLLLAPRDRDTISGDLHEAFTDLLAHRGRLVATLWYARQLLSLTPRRLFGVESILALLCAFSAMAGAWLGTMDLILQHPGYGRRELIAGTIVAQALLTLALLLLPRGGSLRPFAALGCLPILGLFGTVLIGVLHGADIEGYVLLIALILLVQAMLTAIVVFRKARPGVLPG